MRTKTDIKNLTVLGFALFAMFFGAGNLIFPPYLGLESGDKWFLGFICFIIVDAGLGVAALMAAARNKDGFAGITGVMGKGISKLLMAACALCLGPLVAIPRTGATTFELALAPVLPGCSSWICGAVFFILVFIACVRPGKVIDIVGKVLAPVMLIALAALIVLGIATPIGEMTSGTVAQTAVKNGLESGYQTMDMLGALLFSVVVLSDVSRNGYGEEPKKSRSVLISGIIASAGLFVVYGGLALSGALSGGALSLELGQSGLLLAITEGLLGEWGRLLLGVIVAAACYTTAIGLTTSCAQCFDQLLGGKVSYKLIAGAICLVSFVISNVGITEIIRLASPVLDLLYPVLITLVILALFGRSIKNVNVYRSAALFTFVSALVLLIDKADGVELYTMYWPLADIGLGWVIPAFIGGIAGAFVPEGAIGMHPRMRARRLAVRK